MSNATTRILLGLIRGRSPAEYPPPPYRSRDRRSSSSSRSDRAPFPRPPPRWALGPFDESSPELPDTHRLTLHTRPHTWEKDFIRTWSSPELRRIVRQYFAEGHPSTSEVEPPLRRTMLDIRAELRKRHADAMREQRVVTERLPPFPSPPLQQLAVHLHACGRREIHVHPPPPGVIHVQAPAPPPRVVFYQDQAPTRVVYRHAQESQTAYIQRSGAPRPYESSAPEAGDVEFRPRGRIEGERGKDGRGDSSEED